MVFPAISGGGYVRGGVGWLAMTHLSFLIGESTQNIQCHQTNLQHILMIDNITVPRPTLSKTNMASWINTIFNTRYMFIQLPIRHFWGNPKIWSVFYNEMKKKQESSS